MKTLFGSAPLLLLACSVFEKISIVSEVDVTKEIPQGKLDIRLVFEGREDVGSRALNQEVDLSNIL
jgi:hypothetical protein